MISTALASRSDPVCVRVDTGRDTTFGVLEISTWFIHLSAANNQYGAQAVFSENGADDDDVIYDYAPAA
ncbi:hypothetical protein F2Q69_00046205 [Brassica cretica]|uniref:Uncharacterized protein n=1 Tax=Brassica cretica TaxID=69181 RepID=A0A8S9Q480_BRACR|nr:hypothetical protein F2Q69_00046205 [Brassica cretica]